MTTPQDNGPIRLSFKKNLPESQQTTASISFKKGGGRRRGVTLKLQWTPGHDLDAHLVFLNGNQPPTAIGRDYWVGYVSRCRTPDREHIEWVSPEVLAADMEYADERFPTTPELAAIHSGDDRGDEAATTADDQPATAGEAIDVIFANIDKMPQRCASFIALASINDPGVTFGQMQIAKISICDIDTGEEIVTAENLASELGDETVAIYIRGLRSADDPSHWDVQLIGKGYNDLDHLAEAYKIPTKESA